MSDGSLYVFAGDRLVRLLAQRDGKNRSTQRGRTHRVRPGLLDAGDHALVGRTGPASPSSEPLERRHDVVGVSGVPSWNFTFRRIWNVQVFALLDDFHAVAIRGTRRELLSANTSCSPAMCETASAPSDCRSGGSSVPSVAGEPTRSVPAVIRSLRCGAAGASGTPRKAEQGNLIMPARPAPHQLAARDARPCTRRSTRSRLTRALAYASWLLSWVAHRSSSFVSAPPSGLTCGA